MREKDIKKIFENCYNSSDKSGKAEVSSERVKASVMEKIGMSAAESFYTDGKREEPVKPIFAAVPKKKRNGAGSRIAVWTSAAACLGAVVIGMGLFGGNGLNFLSQQNGADNKNAPEETAAATEVSGVQNIGLGTPGEGKSMELVFLDGVRYMYDEADYPPYGYSAADRKEFIPFLYEKDNRLYFVRTKNGQEVKEDITDKISSDDFYLFTYNNPDNIADPTHFVIIGGDVSKGEYGCIEIYRASSSTELWGWEANFSDGTDTLDFHTALFYPEKSEKKWIANGVKEVTEKYGRSADVISDGIGYYERYVDFKYKDHYDYGHTKLNLLPCLQLTFINGGRAVLVPSDDRVITNGLYYYEDTDKLSPVIYEENGRVYFAVNNEDITDKINPDDCYIYSYNNPGNTVNQTHYVIVCGDLSKGEYGYWEVYQIHKAEDELDYDRWEWYGKYSGTEKPSEKEWFINAKEVMEKEYGIDQTFSSGTTDCNSFKGAANYVPNEGDGEKDASLENIHNDAQDEKIFQLTLLDGGLIETYYGDSSVHAVSNPRTKSLLFKENDRLFFNDGKGYKEDITDKLNSDGFYVYVYENPQNPFNKTHYVVVGGDLSKDYYGYWEVYQGGVDSWDKSGTFNCGSFDGDIENPQWAYDAAKFLKEEYGAELPLIGVYEADNSN